MAPKAPSNENENVSKVHDLVKINVKLGKVLYSQPLKRNLITVLSFEDYVFKINDRCTRTQFVHYYRYLFFREFSKMKNIE